MSALIVQSRLPITLLGASQSGRRSLDAALRLAPTLVAADGGANVAADLGLIPDAVIGDLDSLDEKARMAIPQERIWRIEEQTSTDFEKCLTRISAPYVLALGFVGRRVDHTLAAWNAILRHGKGRCLVIGPEDVTFAAPSAIRIRLRAGTRVSLFPMVQVTGCSSGLRWPIEGLDFAPDGRIGTSNEATGEVALEFDRPGMLVTLPKPALKAAISGLLSAPGW